MEGKKWRKGQEETREGTEEKRSKIKMEVAAQGWEERTEDGSTCSSYLFGLSDVEFNVLLSSGVARHQKASFSPHKPLTSQLAFKHGISHKA